MDGNGTNWGDVITSSVGGWLDYLNQRELRRTVPSQNDVQAAVLNAQMLAAQSSQKQMFMVAAAVAVAVYLVTR